MTLSEIATYVCNLIGKTDSTSLTRCKEYIRQHHELIYDSALWRESLIVERVTMEPDGRVTHIEVTGGGSGYTSAPTVSFSAGGTGYVAPTATAKILNGKVSEIILTKGGNGYETNPTVTLTGEPALELRQKHMQPATTMSSSSHNQFPKCSQLRQTTKSLDRRTSLRSIWWIQVLLRSLALLPLFLLFLLWVSILIFLTAVFILIWPVQAMLARRSR